ncbi:MAG: hypothetical protein ACKVOK_10180 [Flavobacteriales bacterium]
MSSLINKSENTKKSCFFITPSAFSQNENQRFGPIGADDIEKQNNFRISTSIVATGDNAIAYAVTSGRVLIQRQDGSTDKLNLILQPTEQPIPGIRIAYFIYRGLRAADFFTLNSESELMISTSTSFESQLINTLIQELTDFYAEPIQDTNNNIIPTPTFNSDILGLGLPDTHTIQSIFQTNFDNPTNFSLPHVTIGMSLGRFFEGPCSIEIILEHPNHFSNCQLNEILTLSFARKQEGILSTSDATTSHKLYRELIFSFLDAVSFYGHHAINGSILNPSSNNYILGQEIYQTLLDQFASKNTLYLYILSHRSRSYCFYSDENPEEQSIQHGFDAAALVSSIYSNHSWPIIIIDNSSTIDPNTTKLYLRLFRDSDYSNMMFYSHSNKVESGEYDHFLSNQYLHSSPQINPDNICSNDIIFSLPTVTVNNGPAYILTNFYYLSYIGNSIDFPILNCPFIYSDETYPNIRIYLSDLFSIPNSDFPSNQGYSAINQKKLCHSLLVGKRDKNQDYITVGHTALYFDYLQSDEFNSCSRSTFIYCPDNTFNPHIAHSSRFSNTALFLSNSNSFNIHANNNLTRDLKLSTFTFTDLTNSIIGISQNRSLDGISNFLLLGISSNELQVLQISSSEYKNSRIGLLHTNSQSSKYLSTEKTQFYKYILFVIGENIDDHLCEIHTSQPIYIYTTDNRVFYSSEYTQYLPITSIDLEFLNI